MNRRISAVIPTYNNAAYILRAIASIHAQTFLVDEIIVIDDGSSDNTEHVIASVPNVRYFRQSNSGPSAARNRGVEMATGEWIAFLDADDEWTPNKIKLQLEALDKHPELALIASDMAEIDENNRILVPSVLAQHGLLADFETWNGAPIPAALAHLVKKNFIPTGTVLVRRDLIRAIGGFNQDIRYGEDLLLWARIAARHPIACLPVVTMRRRRHDNNVTRNLTPLMRDLTRVMRLLAEECGAQLKSQDTDPSRLVAHQLWELGYYHLVRGEPKAARQALMESLEQRPMPRTFFHLALSLLPPTVVAKLRGKSRE